MSSLWKTALWLLVLVCFVACGGDKPAAKKKPVAKQPSVAEKAAKEKAAWKARQESEKKAEAQKEPEFVFNPVGLRDPFAPFIKIEVKKNEKGREIKICEQRTPLQTFALEELTVVGILWAAEQSKVLIEDPKGKGYFVGAGTYVGDQCGKIVRISHDKVLVEEVNIDLMGAKNIEHTTLTLYKNEDEVR